jgi:choline dehydrogenase-like flavoprotein
MLVDARALPDGSRLATDVCIVGAGPAGITLARELIGAQFRVCLVESGGLDFDRHTQALAALAPIATDLAPPDEARCRRFGGSANTWNVRTTPTGGGVRYLPLDPIDFEPRSWVPDSGWPLQRADLDPFYERAHAVCRIGPYAYRVADWADGEARPLALAEDRVGTVIDQYGAADTFTTTYREELVGAANVTVLLHASAGRLEERPTSAAIKRLHVHCLDRTRHQITASVFVLAAGAIENARLLLLSTDRRPAGLGNQHDLVGRFFMDHHNVRSGMLTPTDRGLFEEAALYDLRRVKGTLIMGKLKLTEQVLRDERLLNGAARLDPKRPPEMVAAARSLRQLMAGVRSGRPPRDTLAHLLRVARCAPQLGFFVWSGRWLRARRGRYGWSELGMKRRRFGAFSVELQVELSPHPENRVVLVGEARDRFDRPLPAVRWRWRALDLTSLERTQHLLAAEFARARLGTMEIPPDGAPPAVLLPGGIHHHLGTTRMHVDPHSGVVDPNCRVHGVDNLFVAGGSVFPTGGYANPTLTIVALALRLGDHLRALMRP